MIRQKIEVVEKVVIIVRKKKIGAYSEGRRGGFRIPLDEVEKYVAAKKRVHMKGADK